MIRRFAFAREAREIFSRQGDQWRLARLELNLGNIFDRRDRFEEALACYESAYRYLSVHSADDPEAVAAALHNIAVSCIRLNDFRKALTYLRASTTLRRRTRDARSGRASGLQHRVAALSARRLQPRESACCERPARLAAPAATNTT